MKLTLQGLQEKEQWKNAGIGLPSYDIEKVAEETKKNPVWVHFGAGNIFRIFIGGIADTLISSGEMKKGITCVETFDFDVVDKIYRPYDNLEMCIRDRFQPDRCGLIQLKLRGPVSLTRTVWWKAHFH